MMVLAIMAGCGGNGGDTTTPPANSPASDGGNTGSSGPLKVANVVNGNLGDKSFCEAGLKKLQDDGIITYKTFELGATDADQPKWVSTLDELSADASYDLIVCGTYQMDAILNDCAQKYPDQKYFIYDAEVAQPNVASITFKQNDLGYLVGTAAALMTSSDMEKINPEKVIGFVGGEVGFNAWAVKQVVPLLQGWGENMSIIMAYLAGVSVNFMLTPLAATAAFTPAIGELGQAMNMNPLPVFYAFGYGIDQYILPYEAVYFLYIFITGKVTLRHVIPALAVRALLCGVILVCVAIPWWKFVGIM